MTAPADETWPKSAVIQGASRGLGLGFVRALLDRGVSVHATCRDPSRAAELSELATRESALHVHRLDVTDEDTIAEAVRAIRANTPQLDLVVNASGVLHGEGLKPERRVEELEARTLLDLMHVNAVGPMLVLKHLLPLLTHDRRAVAASLSARVGSIGDNRRGGWYGYRSSKAALNQLHRSFAVELKRRARNAISVVLHPGTVETRLTEPFRRSVPEGKLFSVETSVGLLLKVIDDLEPEDHGQFFDYAKAPIEW